MSIGRVTTKRVAPPLSAVLSLPRLSSTFSLPIPTSLSLSLSLFQLSRLPRAGHIDFAKNLNCRETFQIRPTSAYNLFKGCRLPIPALNHSSHSSRPFHGGPGRFTSFLFVYNRDLCPSWSDRREFKSAKTSCRKLLLQSFPTRDQVRKSHSNLPRIALPTFPMERRC